MKKEEFDLLLKFHLSLIRRQPSEKTIINAEKILVNNGELLPKSRDIRFKARKLVSNLLQRKEDLIKFQKSNWNGKVDVYNRAYKENPSPSVFDALKVFLYDDDVEINALARSFGVHPQTIKSLKPRFEHYINNAKALREIE